ncbi:hypothetical protein [Geodermatophilus sp. DSM 44513]|uniref:hypothetical protein n=1 Tax=Geodermatophilus sp. DSM 44513 TaxID=1528104 RepID=UPI001274213C|nr:hypothetical protein [Geodermatophilus sp. DSM 44513]WNV75243.1 hypothetical protein RTG05_20005 [Geodermatophilus sp. DSM 44513]
MDGFQRAVAEEGYDVVFGGEDWMAALSAYRDETPATVAHPSPEVAAEAVDKVGLAAARGQGRSAGAADRTGHDSPNCVPTPPRCYTST